MRLRNLEPVRDAGERLSLQLQHDLLDAVVRLARQARQRPVAVVALEIPDDAIGIVRERSRRVVVSPFSSSSVVVPCVA